MEPQTTRKSYKYKLRPTPNQERTLMLCRHVYNAAVGERREAWRMHQKVRRARREFHHEQARKLVQAYDVVYHESLPVANLPKNHPLAKAIADVGWSGFLSILTFKAAEAGKQAVAVYPAFTSQACSGCGALVAEGLSVRWNACPDCGTSLHRDHNAARTILKRGQALRRARQALTQPVGAYVA